MLEETELLDELEKLDERNVHANKLFQLFRSVQDDFPSEHFNAALLYFVASLILKAPVSGLDDTEEEVFIPNSDVPALIESMAELVNSQSADIAYRNGLIAALNVELIHRLMAQFDTLEPRISKRKGFARRLFDIMLRRILSDDYRISLYHSHVVASLAVSLCKTKKRIIETFPYSGAMTVTASVLKKDLETYYSQSHGYPYTHQDLIRLRMKLRKLSLDPWIPDRSELESGDLTVLDGGQVHGSHTFPALATLKQLSRQGTQIDVALVIVDHANGSQLPEELRQYIVENDLLEAVIDLPSLDASGARTVITAWLLNANKENRKETLCVDATLLVDSGYFEPTWFAAAIVERWRSPNLKINASVFKQVLGSSLKGLLLKYFENDYRDLPGLCRTMVSDQVLNVVRLTAHEHLGQQKGRTGLLSLDDRPLRRVLFEGKTAASCSYIIGNNGEGKSLLLKDLIGALDQEKLDSVGIAFGALDRFPLEPQEGSLFNYQGARATIDTLQPHEFFLKTLSDGLLQIYQEHSRLESFSQVLDLLKFNHRHYLVPIDNPDSQIDDWERRFAIIELHEDIQEPSGDDIYEPGLQREENSSIVPFSELSSGEQQILSLLIKICAKADSDTVFLIDEPEISLHVSWQQQLPALLSLIAKEFQCSFVVATHSPIVVANARDKISHCFLARNQVLTPIPSHQRHSVESILLDGFNTYTPDNREINERCAVLVSRAILVTNQPGRVDLHQRDVLLGALEMMQRTMRTSTGRKHGKRFKQDEGLIKEAVAAIEELFKHAMKGAQ